MLLVLEILAYNFLLFSFCLKVLLPEQLETRNVQCKFSSSLSDTSACR